MIATTVHFVDRSTTVLFPASTAVVTSGGFLALISAYFDTLPFHNSNEDAVIGGLLVGEMYKAGAGHTSAPYGAILTVTT